MSEPNDLDVQHLRRILTSDRWLMDILGVVREVDPPGWVVGAGVIRNIVWDRFHGLERRTPLRDLDIAYFDPSDVTRERDEAIAERLRERRRKLPWEVTNQAGGLGLACDGALDRACRGERITELRLLPGLDATSVAVRLLPDGQLDVIAPCGLTDLLGLMLRRNPRQVSEEDVRAAPARQAHRRAVAGRDHRR